MKWGKPAPGGRRVLTSPRVKRSFPGGLSGLRLEPPGVLACKSKGCSHLHALALQLEHSYPQGTDPTEEGLLMLPRRDAQAQQVPAKMDWSDPAGATPPSALPPSAWTGPLGSQTHCAVMAATASRLP